MYFFALSPPPPLLRLPIPLPTAVLLNAPYPGARELAAPNHDQKSAEAVPEREARIDVASGNQREKQQAGHRQEKYKKIVKHETGEGRDGHGDGGGSIVPELRLCN